LLPSSAIARQLKALCRHAARVQCHHTGSALAPWRRAPLRASPCTWALTPEQPTARHAPQSATTTTARQRGARHASRSVMTTAAKAWRPSNNKHGLVRKMQRCCGTVLPVCLHWAGWRREEGRVCVKPPRCDKPQGRASRRVTTGTPPLPTAIIYVRTRLGD
jgi:hypothetical protein